MDATVVAAVPAKPHGAISIARTISSFPTLIVAALIAKVFWTCRDGIADPDLWWHLRNAEYLVMNHRLPAVDTYSYTAAGSAWINHEWLSELVYYAGFRAAGLRGIFVIFTLALAALVVVVFWLCRREGADPFAAAIATLGGGFLAMVGFGPRTQTFGWLCFAAMFAILLRFRATRRAPLWLLPVIFCLWINLHGSWLIGLAVYVIFLAAGLVRRDVGQLAADPWSRTEWQRLTVAGLASAAALLVNPYGYRLVLYPFDLVWRQKANIANVQEWASVNFNDPRGKLVMVVLGVIFALALLGRKRWRIDDALLTEFVLYCGLTHIRFLFLAGLVLPPVLAPHFNGISSYDPRQERRWLNTALLAVSIGVMIVGFPSPERLQRQISDFFPERAVAFLRAHPQQGRIFNLYQWGGYLEWNLRDVKTFVDSRSDIFDYKGVLQDHIDAIQLKNTQEILDRYQVSYVLYPANTAFAYYLSKVPQWERIYADGQAVIYRVRPQDRK